MRGKVFSLLPTTGDLRWTENLTSLDFVEQKELVLEADGCPGMQIQVHVFDLELNLAA